MSNSDIKNSFETNGFYVMENVVSEDLINDYNNYWYEKVEKGLVKDGVDTHGHPLKANRTSYLDHPEVMNILCSEEFNSIFEEIDKGVALHLNLDYEYSTEKEWHQDAVLPTKIAGDNYTGVWVAIEDIHPDAGPLELVPGSHLWDIDFKSLYKKDFSYLEASYVLAEEIEKRNAEIFTFLPKKGDALVWHGRLIHRGSLPKNRDLTRRSLIGHYCNMYSNPFQTDDNVSPPSEKIFREMDLETKQYARWNNTGGYYFVDPEGINYK